MSTIQTPARMPRLAPIPGGPLVAAPVQAKLARRTVQADSVATLRPMPSLTGVNVADTTGMGAALRPQGARSLRQSSGEYREFLRAARNAERQLSSAKMMVWSNASIAKMYADQARWSLFNASFADAPSSARWGVRDAKNSVERAIMHLDRASRGDEGAKALANHELFFAETRLRSAIRDAERGR